MKNRKIEDLILVILHSIIIILAALLMIGAARYEEPFYQSTAPEKTEYTSKPKSQPAEEYYPPIEPMFVKKADIPLSGEMQFYIWKQCKAYGIDHDLMLVIIESESGFDINALNYNKNGTTDSGLCQINSVNYKEANALGLDPDDPYDNIEFACFVLADLMERYDLEDSLRAYNQGEGGMKKGYGAEYAAKIMSKLEDKQN